jgi:hypothetical protein
MTLRKRRSLTLSTLFIPRGKNGKETFIERITFALKQKKFLVVFMLGMSAGLPLMLVASSLKVWLRREEIDLSTVGMVSWLMIPYSFNFYGHRCLIIFL